MRKLSIALKIKCNKVQMALFKILLKFALKITLKIGGNLTHLLENFERAKAQSIKHWNNGKLSLHYYTIIL